MIMDIKSIEETGKDTVDVAVNVDEQQQIQTDQEGSFRCSEHPYITNPGGVCPLCLQEKLGKLLSSSSSSSFPVLAVVGPTASSSSSSSPPCSPSFRSERNASDSLPVARSGNIGVAQGYYCPFLPTRAQWKKKTTVASAAGDRTAGIVFKRSKSTAVPRTRGLVGGGDVSHRKRAGLLSFLQISSKSRGSNERKSGRENGPSSSFSSASTSLSRRIEAENDDVSPNTASFERKVSRSRSVGCGSRSFSGDFFGRISNGFGDCALRRAESQRESKPKINHGHDHAIKEKVRCGIFRGFMMTSSSSSSSSSSNWVSSSSSAADHQHHPRLEDGVNGMKPRVSVGTRGRSRSWGWAFSARHFCKDPKRNRFIRDGNGKNIATNTSR